MRLLSFIVAFLLICSARAEESEPMLLERAVQLETAAGDVEGAERIYQRLARRTAQPYRVRAEATYRLAELYAREANNKEAKQLLLQVLRDFPDATDLIPLAEGELTNVTAMITRDQIGENLAGVHHVGDLAIAIRGALENREKKRAGALLQRLNGALEALTEGKDAPDVLMALKRIASEITRTLHAEPSGGIPAALSQLKQAKQFEPFLERGFPSDPHDLFAPAWRLKDRLARALAEENLELTKEEAGRLNQYLSPVANLPGGPEEGTLARLLVYAVKEILALAEEGNFAAARVRLDQLDSERHEQFKEFRESPEIQKFPTRMPTDAVAAQWAVLHLTQLARSELSKGGDAVSMDHVAEAAKVCREVIPRVENRPAEQFKWQLDALELALWEIKNKRFGPAQQALRRVTEKAP